MIECLEDPAVATVIVRAAPEVRFYAGVHEGDTFAVLRRWLEMAGNMKAAVEVLNAVISQRLIRKLCNTCKVPYDADPDVLRKLNLSADRVHQLYKHSGQVRFKDRKETCPNCLGIGYRGRVGIFEVMVFDDEARRHLMTGQLHHLRSHLRKRRMLWLQEAALANAVDGVTSIREITRTLSQEGQAPVPQGQAPSPG